MRGVKEIWVCCDPAKLERDISGFLKLEGLGQ
jgi:hypothetical protein